MQGKHYEGVVAEWYDEWLGRRRDDVEFYADFFAGYTGTVLELACGTGRILLPIAAAGVDIHGLDGSADMCRILESKAATDGFPEVQVFEQSMESFSLGMEFDAIFVSSGSFQLLTELDDVKSSLSCVYQHLKEGGSFVADLFIPWDDIAAQESEGYRVTRDSVRSNGDRSIVHERFEIDLVNQLKIGTYRYEIYSDKRLVSSVIDDLNIRWFWKDEMIRLLEDAGFSDIKLLTDSPMYQEGYSLVFNAVK